MVSVVVATVLLLILYLWAATVLFPSPFLYFSHGGWCFGQIAIAVVLLFFSLWGLQAHWKHSWEDDDSLSSNLFPRHSERWEWRATRRMVSQKWIQSHRNRYTQLCNAERLGDSSAHSLLSLSSPGVSDIDPSISSLTSSRLGSCRRLYHRHHLLLRILLALLITKSCLLLLINSPVALMNPVVAFLLQPVGSRLLDLVILQLFFWILQGCLVSPPPPDAFDSLSSSHSSPAVSDSQTPSVGLGLPWRDLSADFEDILNSRRYLDLESSSSLSSLSHSGYRRWDVVVTDPGQEFSLQDLRCPQPVAELERTATRGKQRRQGSPYAEGATGAAIDPPPPSRLRLHQPDPQDILDDLLTI